MTPFERHHFAQQITDLWNTGGFDRIVQIGQCPVTLPAEPQRALGDCEAIIKAQTRPGTLFVIADLPDHIEFCGPIYRALGDGAAMVVRGDADGADGSMWRWLDKMGLTTTAETDEFDQPEATRIATIRRA